MKRLVLSPRPNWEARVAEQGISFACVDGKPYWDESAAYEFTAAEIDRIEAATNELHRICLEAGQTIVDRRWYDRLGLPPAAIPLIEASWEADEPSLYGRFDLACDGEGAIKMLEYNADTPTALVEAAVAQWYWLEDLYPGCDQFNSLHERLVKAWRFYADKTGAERIHLCALRESLEDNQTILYLEDTLRSAKIACARLPVEDIGWDGQRLVDWDAEPIAHLFKLYPWEWMLHEEYGPHIAASGARFLEPAWKMLLSSKGLLPILWELYPDHPNLLPAYRTEDAKLGGNFVRKPLFSREGANVEIHRGGVCVNRTEGPYGEEGWVWQAIAGLAEFDGRRPILGSWVINHESAGMGIREDAQPISTNNSRFIPHLFRD